MRFLLEILLKSRKKTLWLKTKYKVTLKIIYNLLLAELLTVKYSKKWPQPVKQLILFYNYPFRKPPGLNNQNWLLQEDMTKCLIKQKLYFLAKARCSHSDFLSSSQTEWLKTLSLQSHGVAMIAKSFQLMQLSFPPIVAKYQPVPLQSRGLWGICWSCLGTRHRETSVIHVIGIPWPAPGVFGLWILGDWGQAKIAEPVWKACLSETN